MYILVLIVHIIVCLFLVIVVLLQSGKAADLAGAFGGMGSQTAFGPRGSATLLSKATTISAALFMVTSLSLSILATRKAAWRRQFGARTVENDSGEDAAPQPAPPQERRSKYRCRNRMPPTRQDGSDDNPSASPGSAGAGKEVSSPQCGGGGIGRRTSLRC